MYTIRLLHRCCGVLSRLSPLVLSLLTGCADWSATPVRVQQHYGLSSRALVVNQIYDPAAARHPAALAPDGIEGQKAATILQRAYQADIGDPKRVRAPGQLNISGGGQGGASSGMSSSGSQ